MTMPKVKILNSVEGYDLAAANYDQMQDYLNSFEKEQIPLILGAVKGKKVLDVGAGTGRLSILLAKAGAHVTACDVSVSMLEILKKKNPRIAIVVADAENLPFPDGSFDMVTAAFLIVHLSDPTTFFTEAYRVLKDGGVLLITNINQKEPPEVKTTQGPIKIESYYHRPAEIIEKLENLAFNVEETMVKEGDVWVNQIVKAVK